MTEPYIYITTYHRSERVRRTLIPIALTCSSEIHLTPEPVPSFVGADFPSKQQGSRKQLSCEKLSQNTAALDSQIL